MSKILIKNTGAEPKAFANVPYMNPGDTVEVDSSRKEELLQDKDIKIVSNPASDKEVKSKNKQRGGAMTESSDNNFKAVEA